MTCVFGTGGLREGECTATCPGVMLGRPSPSPVGCAGYFSLALFTMLQVRFLSACLPVYSVSAPMSVPVSESEFLFFGRHIQPDTPSTPSANAQSRTQENRYTSRCSHTQTCAWRAAHTGGDGRRMGRVCRAPYHRYQRSGRASGGGGSRQRLLHGGERRGRRLVAGHESGGGAFLWALLLGKVRSTTSMFRGYLIAGEAFMVSEWTCFVSDLGEYVYGELYF